MRKTAFEELAEWCEKYMPVGLYQIVEESNSYHKTIYLDLYEDEIPYMAFSKEGNFVCSGVLSDEDRIEHIRDLEATEREASKPDLVPTSICGMMVRKMIEKYERNMNK